MSEPLKDYGEVLLSRLDKITDPELRIKFLIGLNTDHLEALALALGKRHLKEMRGKK